MDLRRWELKLVVHPDRVSVIGVICVQEKITDIASKVAPKRWVAKWADGKIIESAVRH